MSFVIWFRKNVMKQVPSFKLGGLEMGCYCTNHLDHNLCNADCHGGISGTLGCIGS